MGELTWVCSKNPDPIVLVEERKRNKEAAGFVLIGGGWHSRWVVLAGGGFHCGRASCLKEVVVAKMKEVIVALLPYLEAGVKRHPQVLNWLNTKRRRVFASSSFSLFAEVTRILRTTRRVDLTEDDQNYIKECCPVLQGFHFDDGWIGYVHGRIEKCGDEEDLEWKVEEDEAEASNLKAQLESTKKEFASVEESLVSLLQKC
ncbi:hypothetical protein K1719_016777 [Acacia pycnantha]|nr:hypothetical protein K1719_016777 [Acacia pycnantha]